MNKITSTLAGLALVAGVSVAPAFAQGNLFSPPGNFSFVSSGTTLTASGSGDSFNEIGTGIIHPVSFTLTGAASGTPGIFNVTAFNVLSGTTSLVTLDATSGLTFVAGTSSTGGQFISSIGAVAGKTAATNGTSFNLVSPVPEASTVVSFGALLALGGLAVLRRKSVKNVG